VSQPILHTEFKGINKKIGMHDNSESIVFDAPGVEKYDKVKWREVLVDITKHQPDWKERAFNIH